MEITLRSIAEFGFVTIVLVYSGICLLIPPAILLVLLKILGVI